MEMLKKQYISKVDVDNETRTVTAVISTASVDRDNEVLLPKGAQLTQFKKNPVVLWAHDYHDTPIGKAMWIKRDTDNIAAKVKFPDEGVSDKSDEVYDLFKGGFLKAFSVGFNPIKSHSPEPDEIKKNPEWANVRRVYDKWELLEFSAVPVPANPEALVTAVKSHKVDLSDETKSDFGESFSFLEDEAENIYCEDKDEEIVEAKPLAFKSQPKQLPMFKAKIPFRRSFTMEDALKDIGKYINEKISDRVDRRKGKVY